MAEDKLKALRYQALQNETLKNRDFVESDGAIYKRSKHADESTFMEGNLIPLQRGDVFWLIEEIERLRAEAVQREAEIAALREALEAARQALIIIGDGAHSLHYAGVPAGGQYALQEINRTAKDMLNRLNTFNAAPVETAPATIKVGDSVRITKEGARKGHVGSVTRLPEDNDGLYEVKLGHLSNIFETVLTDYTRDEIEPA